MNVRFKGSPAIHRLTVTVPGPGLVQLPPILPDGIEPTAGFVVLTDKGSLYGDYTGYNTVYRELKDGSLILSDDGRVYVPPEPTQDPDPGEDTVDPAVPGVTIGERVSALEQAVYNI